MDINEAVSWLARMLAKREFGPRYEGYESTHREMAEFCVEHLAPYLRPLEDVRTAAQALAEHCKRGVNVGPVSLAPATEAALWINLRNALEATTK